MAKDELGRNAQGTESGAGEQRGDERDALEQALRRPRDDEALLGQTAENVNLTGSTTYETLPEDGGGERVQHARKGQAESPRELGHNEPPHMKEGHGTHPPGRV